MSEAIKQTTKRKLCKDQDCSIRPVFGYAGEAPIYCKKHKEDDMVNVCDRHCEIEGCDRRPSFRIIGKPYTHCKEHKVVGMQDVKGKIVEAPKPTRKAQLCKYTGCPVSPSFGNVGGSPMFCVTHKEVSMVNVKDPKCVQCNKRPSYGFKRGKATHCYDHHDNGMVSKVKSTSSLCMAIKCKKKPCYGFEGKPATRCTLHKCKDMVNRVKQFCENENCNVRATFNLSGCKPKFCKTHKTSDMIDVVGKYCSFPPCNTRASFGYKGKQPTHCSKHKEDDMVSLIGRNCNEPECQNKAIYKHEGQNVEKCKDHKLEGMVLCTTKKVYCVDPNCNEQVAKYAKKGEKPTYCRVHKKEDMINVTTKLCDIQNCTKGATWGCPTKQPTHCYNHHIQGQMYNPTKRCSVEKCRGYAFYGVHKPEHCEKHKLDEEVNFVEQRCTGCQLVTVVSKDKVCEMCDPNAFKQVRLAKQNAVENYLKENGLKFESVDKTIDGGICGKERPDFIIQGLHQVIVVECDENQHASIAKECELAREINVSQSLGTPTAFIRFNPDKYTLTNGEQGKMCISKRYPVLLNWIKQLMNEEPRGFLTKVKLFYDGYYGGHEKLHVIIPLD